MGPVSGHVTFHFHVYQLNKTNKIIFYYSPGNRVPTADHTNIRQSPAIMYLTYNKEGKTSTEIIIMYLKRWINKVSESL